MNRHQFDQLKLKRLEALSHLSSTKTVVSDQKKNWVLHRTPTSLEDRVQAENAVVRAQEAVDDINYEIHSSRDYVVNEKRQDHLKILLNILRREGLGDIIQEAQSELEKLGHPLARELSIQY